LSVEVSLLNTTRCKARIAIKPGHSSVDTVVLLVMEVRRFKCTVHVGDGPMEIRQATTALGFVFSIEFQSRSDMLRNMVVVSRGKERK
jgi:hypothetical protein